MDFLKTYLRAKLEIGLTRQAAELAMNAAKTFEQRSPALAVAAYRGFAPLIADRKDARLAGISVERFESATKQWHPARATAPRGIGKRGA